MTGSGSSGRASFEVSASVQPNGTPQGCIAFFDSYSGYFVRSTQITAIVLGPDNQARILGRATLNGSGSHPFVIDVIDRSEPGPGADAFRLVCNSTVIAEAYISRGNIQVQKIK